MKKTTLLLLTLITLFGWQAQAQFAENFDAGTTLPAGWGILNGGGAGTWVFGAPGAGTAQSGTNVAKIVYNAVAHDDYLVTPQIAVVAGVNNRITFWVRNRSATFVEHFDVKLSTAGATAPEFTVTLVPDTAAPQTWTQMNIDLTAYAGQSVYVGFHAVSTDEWELYFDDIVNDAPPSVAPSCATGLVATPHATCGNFPTSLVWNAVAGVTGYNLSIGTTPGGTDVLNNQNLGIVTSYSFVSPSPNTLYYWNLTPFNGVGPAVGCVEQSFTTFATPCFCTPAPSSIDGTGITNVTFGTINNTTADEAGHYGDYSAQSTNVGQGLMQNLSITYATAYTYGTKIWVDWNNDYDFDDAGELVYTGLSTNANPTTLAASFVVPIAAPLGLHRMRIGGADDDTGPTSPCYTGAYGTFEDYSVNVVVASCTPPAATAAVTADCGNNQYFVDVNVTNLGSGTPTISDGTTTWPIAGLGNVQVGPFASGSSVTLNVLHGSDGTCNVLLGSYSYTCPPTNDNCINAVVLTPGGDFTTNPLIATNVGATNSTPPAPGCASFLGGDVWYSVAIPASGNLTIETNNNTAGGSTITDTGMAVYSGTCGVLTLISCNDDTSLDGNFSLISLTGRTPGEVVFVNAWEYGNDSFGTFKISAYDASLGTNSFNNANFSYYPNPVKNMLNLSYTENISDVAVYNLLGQQVIAKVINANQSQIDMSQLASGTYMVKVTADNQVKTIKVIKE